MNTFMERILWSRSGEMEQLFKRPMQWVVMCLSWASVRTPHQHKNRNEPIMLNKM